MNQNKFYGQNRIAYSHNKNDWRTPKDLFEKLDREFRFTVDLCASKENALCKKFYTEESDGLKADLTGENVFCNPPYERKLQYAFIRKCAESKSNVCVMLIPDRTDTKMFHEYIYGKAEIRFIKGRLKFSNAEHNAPFPSMIVIFKN